MGENRASGEGILGGFVWEEALCNEDDHPAIVQNTVRLYSFYSDKLKCVHSRSFGYSKSKFNFNLEAGLIVKRITGEKNYA
ncbi:MAG TPA: hypothetical protein VF350_03665 [Candidatus Bathyarchaeia archaeon]